MKFYVQKFMVAEKILLFFSHSQYNKNTTITFSVKLMQSYQCKHLVPVVLRVDALSIG